MGALVLVFTHGALSCVNKCEERERGTSEQIGESREVGVLKADRFSFPLQLSGKKKEKKGGGAKGDERGEQATSCRCSHAEKQQTADYCVFSCTSQGRRGRRLFSAWLVSNGPVKKLDCFPLSPPRRVAVHPLV